jgi:putative membrane-bound dehydrogenase-like protein
MRIMTMMAGLWLALGLLAAGPDAAGPPRTTDARLALVRFAAEPDIVTPVGIAVDARGRVFVVESHTHFRPENYPGPPADRIRVFEDTDGDGRADRITTFFEGTRRTMALAFDRDGSLVVATRGEVFRLRDTNGDGTADERTPIARLETTGDYPHNGLSGVVLDFAGDVYFGLGENLGAPYQLIGRDGTTLSGGGEGGNVYRCRPDGSGLGRIATGFWNPFGLAFDAFGRLFAVDNDPDSRPPCRLLHVVAGGDYGYRFRNGRKGLHPFTAWNGELPGTLPMVAGTGEAPGGVVAYESDNLRADDRGSLLVTSWGDHRIERYRPQPRGASFRATMEPVVVGGEDFRPVGLAVAPDGSLFISDWVDKSYALHGKGRIWHLRAAKPPWRIEPERPDEALVHPDRAIREAMARRMMREPTEAGSATLLMTARSNPDPRARATALEAIRTLPEGPDSAARAASSDASADVRALAVRSLLVDRTVLKGVAASDASPLVRAEALRRLADPDAQGILLTALEADDPFLRQAAHEGLRHSLGLPALLELAGSRNTAHRLGALLVLRESDEPGARDVLPKLLADLDPTVRFAAVQWVGERGLTEYRQALLDGLASGAASRSLFEGYLAALERLDGVRRDATQEIGGEDYVAALVLDPKTTPSVRRRALRMLRPDHPALTLARLQGFLAAPDVDLRLEAVRTLRDGPLPERTALLSGLARDPDQAERLRAEAIVGLAGDGPRGRDVLIDLATAGPPVLRREALRSLRGVSLSDALRTRLADAARGDAALEDLVATLSAPDRAPGSPGPADVAAWLEWLDRQDGPPDPAEGERIFFQPNGPGCYRCHQVDGRGGRAGPDLSATGATLTRPRLVESILRPSLEIAPQFVPWLIARADGTVATGLLIEETPTGAATYADPQGQTFTVPTAEAVERRPMSTSIMPEGLAHAMTPREFRDLVSYLQSPRTGQGTR